MINEEIEEDRIRYFLSLKPRIHHSMVRRIPEISAYERLPNRYYNVLMERDDVCELIELINDTVTEPVFFDTWSDIYNHYSGKTRDGIKLYCYDFVDYMHDGEFVGTYYIGPELDFE